ncbi:hypothetical protein QQS21_006798 [Conoideocrella luteorostrata]|uniref:Wax synthase domain-containing protein n=1 Tax=Conoideocrella luteorostrata TaxID=1105319 RepID=A0AAJ0CP82_9HYPO|nr:hypothetical protein QQS21_006798 [Conoideocrella luteorostrata]
MTGDHAVVQPAFLIRSLALFMFNILITAQILIATPKRSTWRFAWLPGFAALGHVLLKALASTSTSRLINNVLVGEAAFILLQCVNFLVITGIDSECLQQAKIYAYADHFPSKLLSTAGLLINLRGINTQWQAKYVNASLPPLLAAKKDKHSVEHRRRSYLIRQALLASWQYLFLDVVHQSSVKNKPYEDPDMFAAGSEFMYSGLTSEQWATRIAITLISGLGAARIQIDYLYRICSIIAVLARVSGPDDWPPLFGSLTQAYSLRRFWT